MKGEAKRRRQETRHSILEGSFRHPLHGAVAKKPCNPREILTILVVVRRKYEIPRSVVRPRRRMSKMAFVARHGADPLAVRKIVQTFHRYGLRLVEQDIAARTLSIRGPVAKFEAVFNVRLFQYAHPDGAYRGRVGPLYIPRELKRMVRGVFGLDNRRIARRGRVRARALVGAAGGTGDDSWYMPADMIKRYNFPVGDGAGQNIAALEFGGGYQPDDLSAFFKAAQVAANPNVTSLSVDGTATDLMDDDTPEVMMDVEILSGICPQASLTLYFAAPTSSGWIGALGRAIHDSTDVGVISISWGAPDDGSTWTQQDRDHIDELLKDAAKLHITVCAATGDNGSSDGCTDGHAHTDFPASSAFLLAVGGTTIPAKGTTQPDVVWKEGTGLDDGSINDGSTGGGVSNVVPRPDWQSGVNIQTVNPGGFNGRCVPDVALNADWTVSPYFTIANGSITRNGGTSAAAPLMAALVTLINGARTNSRVGFLSPQLYQLSAPGGSNTIGAMACTDVTAGDNVTAHVGGYSASKGYDAVSGWGTPDGKKLAALL
jgi:kumamolisin